MNILFYSSQDKSILDQIIKLDEEYFPFPWTETQWGDSVSKDDWILSYVIDKNQVLGFCLFQFNEIVKLGHLIKILILPEFRSKKYAEKLHSESVQRSPLVSCDSLYLEVGVNNESAIRLYKNLGYETLIRKQRFYSNGEDAFAMQCKLN